MKGNRWLLVISSLGGGGAERVTAMFSEYLRSAKGCEVTILLLEGETKKYNVDCGVRVVYSPFLPFCKGILKFILIPLHAIYMSYLIRKLDITNVVSFLHRPNIVNCISSILSRRPYYYSERSLISKSYNGLMQKVMRFALRWCYSKTERCIAISNEVKKELVSIGVDKSRIEVINNPVEIYKEWGAKCGNHQGMSFVTAGRLIRSKRVDLIIDAFSKFYVGNKSSTLDIFGEGPEKLNLKKMVDDLNLQTVVNFKGFVKDLHVELRERDCFLFASEYESFGNVIIESASVGVPSILPRDLESIQDISHDNHGFLLYERENIDDMVRCMNSLNNKEIYSRLSFEAIYNASRFKKEYIFRNYFNVLGGR